MKSNVDITRLNRRRALALFGLGLPGMVVACSSNEAPVTRGKTPATDGTSSGDDTPPTSSTTDTGGDDATDVPSQFEARAAELEKNGIFTKSNPGPWAGKEAKHVPTVALEAGAVTVRVAHEMRATASDAGGPHYITTIYIRDQNEKIIGLKEYTGTESSPDVRFTVPAGTTSVVAYANCNLHGLWSSRDLGAKPETDAGAKNATWEARAQALEAAGLYSAANEGPMVGKAAKHVPRVELASGAVLVSVAHEMRPGGAGDAGGAGDGGDAGDAGADLDAGDAGEGGNAGNAGDAAPPLPGEHYIGTIYLRNQDKVVIGLKELKPNDPLPVALFALPAGTTSVTAYAWCNLHGTWMALPLTTT